MQIVGRERSLSRAVSAFEIVGTLLDGTEDQQTS
jgi:hypothetical protein